jgi:tight adherence protein B
MRAILEMNWFAYAKYIKWGAAILLGLCITALAYRISTDPTTLPYRLWTKYVAMLNRNLRRLFQPLRGTTIAVCQALALCGIVFGAVMGLPIWCAVVGGLIVAVVPLYVFKKRLKERSVKLENQVVPFTIALANALKSTANIGTALEVLEPMMLPPIQQELGLAIKEMRVGSSLDDSLLGMSARSGSQDLEATLSAVLIGRKVGGHLPEILDTTSKTLREIMRLNGAVRSKTASGRSQLMVLGGAPAVVLVLFELVKPGYFDPLTATATGWVVCMIIAALWIVGILLARKVLKVEV